MKTNYRPLVRLSGKRPPAEHAAGEARVSKRGTYTAAEPLTSLVTGDRTAESVHRKSMKVATHKSRSEGECGGESEQ